MNFQQTLDVNEKVIIQFHADWCGSCKLIAPKYRRLSEDPRFETVVFIEINSEDNPEARKLAGADNLPFFATFDRGILVERAATAREETIVAMLEKLKQ